MFNIALIDYFLVEDDKTLQEAGGERSQIGNLADKIRSIISFLVT